MGFLCNRHYAELCQCPEKALRFWRQTIARSRSLMLTQQWGKAVTTYGNALEAGEILLQGNVDSLPAAHRYLDTASELTMVLLHCGMEDSAAQLGVRVSRCLQKAGLESLYEAYTVTSNSKPTLGMHLKQTHPDCQMMV